VTPDDYARLLAELDLRPRVIELSQLPAPPTSIA
jgi:hypothetical protein